MSQMNRNKEAQNSSIPANIDPNQIAKEIEKLKPHEQQALLKEIEQELKAETSKEAAPLLEFVLKHIRVIILGIIVFIILAVAFGVWQWKVDTAFKEANSTFVTITDMQDPAQKIEALKSLAKTAPKDLKLPILLEEASAAAQVKQFDLAITSLREAIELTKDTAFALSLHFALADVYVTANKPEEALKLMDELAKTAPEALKNSLLEERALLSESIGNKEKAISCYQELIAASTPETASTNAFYQSRIDELSK